MYKKHRTEKVVTRTSVGACICTNYCIKKDASCQTTSRKKAFFLFSAFFSKIWNPHQMNTHSQIRWYLINHIITKKK